jgi:hypothetical protein
MGIIGKPQVEILATVNSMPVELWFTIEQYMMKNLVMQKDPLS